jgi:ribosomal-protein-alanine N-acetyltransferase
MPARLRSPSTSDAEAVLAVILARDVADVGAPDFTLEDLKADWATRGLTLTDDVRVAGADGEVRGYAVLLGDDAIVIVHPKAENEPDARGRGHGRTLLLGLFDAFRRAGLKHAELSVHGRNRGALRLYESVGMRPTWQAERWEKALGSA